MPINRKLWKDGFEEFPRWTCPSCQAGALLVKKDTLKCEETGPSREAHSHEAWDPEWVVERFTGVLSCPSCSEVVVVVGETSLHENHDHERQELNWDRRYSPTFFMPALPIIPFHNECPALVTEQLTRAFSLFWSDVGSAANRLRSAVEALLTDRGIARTTISKKTGKRVALSLHARIDRFKKKDATASDFLLAIKWLGNTGSHAGIDQLDRNDLLDGFELLDHVIERIYVRPEQSLRKIAKGINARKGKPAKRRAKR